jgi:hypothetical protein
MPKFPLANVSVMNLKGCLTVANCRKTPELQDWEKKANDSLDYCAT